MGLQSRKDLPRGSFAEGLCVKASIATKQKKPNTTRTGAMLAEARGSIINKHMSGAATVHAAEAWQKGFAEDTVPGSHRKGKSTFGTCAKQPGLTR